MTQTKASNPANDVTATEHQPSSDAERLRHRIRLARERFGAERTTRGHPFTETAQLDFLALLAVGMPITEITRTLGVASSTIYHRRQTNSNFAQDWAIALEMRYAEIEDRLADIAMRGRMDAMATIRAAEILLRATNPRYRPTSRGERPDPPAFPIVPFLGLAPTADFPDRGLPPGWQDNDNTYKPAPPFPFPSASPKATISPISPISPIQQSRAAAPSLAPGHGGKSDRRPSLGAGLGTRNVNPGTPATSPISPTSPVQPPYRLPESKIQNPQSKIPSASPISPIQQPRGAALFLSPEHRGKPNRRLSGGGGPGTRKVEPGTPAASPISPTAGRSATGRGSVSPGIRNVGLGFQAHSGNPWALRRRLAAG